MVTDILSSEPSGVFGRHAVLVLRRTLVVLSATLIASLAALGVLAILTARGAGAAPLQGAGLDEGAAAGLFFDAGREDALFEAPTVASDVAIDLNGQVARVTVRQHFVNPSAVWLEGIYVFPLPEGSAVDRLAMTIGERRIEGRILEKQEAERVYRQAAAEGHKASLLSSKRPNVFVTSVANVGPGEAVVIEIGYQDTARYDGGAFSYRFPMVVAPRYTPGVAVPLVRAPFTPEKPGLPGQPIAHPQPASHRGDETGAPPRGRDLFGPVRRPEEGLANPVTLRVRLDAGLPIAALDSLHHPVEVESLGERRRIITLADGAVPADRDFVLEWRAAPSASPEAALFGEQVDGEAYLMVSLLPPRDTAHGDLAPQDMPPPRDLMFVIDTSGSMHGLSIEQARKALALALGRLQPQDRFNVIRFDNTTEALFDAARPATPDALRRAEAYVLSLRAEGGTEMRPALARALDEPLLPGRLRQVVFLTDGAVSNEQELFTLIAERLGEARLFTIGIGSAPNSYFMRKAAELGRGSFTYIGDLREVSERMTALFNKLERPALTDVALRFPESAGDGVELYPARVPDLYAGEPVVFSLRLAGLALDDLKGELVITGRRGARLWERRLPLGHGTVAPGVASLWARAKFAEITDGLTRGEDPVRVRKAALEVALPHRLVTRFTSLVAVDDQVSRPRDAGLESAEVARNLPKGMDYEHVFGKLGETMQLRTLPAPLVQKAAAGAGGADRAIALPQTATPASWLALSGLVLLLLAAALLIATGRLRRAGVVRRAEA